MKYLYGQSLKISRDLWISSVLRIVVETISTTISSISLPGLKGDSTTAWIEANYAFSRISHARCFRFDRKFVAKFDVLGTVGVSQFVSRWKQDASRRLRPIISTSLTAPRKRKRIFSVLVNGSLINDSWTFNAHGGSPCTLISKLRPLKQRSRHRLLFLSCYSAVRYRKYLRVHTFGVNIFTQGADADDQSILPDNTIGKESSSL